MGFWLDPSSCRLYEPQALDELDEDAKMGVQLMIVVVRHYFQLEILRSCTSVDVASVDGLAHAIKPHRIAVTNLVRRHLGIMKCGNLNS